jgi:hypothetical protein
MVGEACLKIPQVGAFLTMVGSRTVRVVSVFGAGGVWRHLVFGVHGLFRAFWDLRKEL